MVEVIRLSNRLFQCKLDGLHECIMFSNQVTDIMVRHFAQRPFHLNVIEAACRGRFKETGHSLVLADMLKHLYIQSSFLSTFLGLQHEYMKVTRETDRVDVALKSDDMFVIIENKVNAAEEQENQVYRYVHEIGMEKYGYDMSQIYVVYLNPTNRIPPSEYSLCDDNNENNVFEDLGEGHYTIQSYKYDITSWLRELSIDNEPHISSALDQYIDFLENKFHTSPLDKNMNNEIKQFLLKELQIEGKSYNEQIAALDNQHEKVSELLDAIDNLKIELKKKQSHTMMREWQGQIEKQLGIVLATDDHSFGIQLNNKVWLGVWDGYDSENYLPYWGFQFNGYKKDSMPELSDQIKPIVKNAGIERYKEEKGWVAWYSTQNGVQRFMSLYQVSKQSGLL